MSLVELASSNGHARDAALRIRSMVDLLADPPPVTPRLLEPSLIVERGLTVLAAPTKVGKTNFWLHVAWALTEGRPLFGRFDVPHSMTVLMLQLELSEPTMYERGEFLRDELGWTLGGLNRFYVRCERAMLLDRRGGADRLVRLIEECPEPPKVVILDSYNAAVAGDPDKSSEARRTLHTLREVQDRTPVAFGITAEIRKAPSGASLRHSIDDLKGSNELAYDADAVLMLRPTDSSRRRLAMDFLAMRHLQGEAPEQLVLVRRGLTFELVEGGGSEEDAEIEGVLVPYFAAGGDRSWRGCIQAVKDAGLHVRDQKVGDVRHGCSKGWRREVHNGVTQFCFGSASRCCRSVCFPLPSFFREAALGSSPPLECRFRFPSLAAWAN